MSTRLVFRWFEVKIITLVPAVAVAVQGTVYFSRVLSSKLLAYIFNSQGCRGARNERWLGSFPREAG
jgi:hypothetical protein